MGAIGSDAAIETADVALMADDLYKDPVADSALQTGYGDHSSEHLDVAWD